MAGNSQEADVIEIDIREIMGVIFSRLALIVSAGVFSALLLFAISNFLLAPIYESTTKIYILNKQDNSAVTYSDVQMGTQLTKDYAELITSRYVLEEVNMELGLDKTYDELLGKVSVTTPTDTRILAITVKDKSPVLAMDIANAIRETAGAHIENVMDIEAVNVVETANLPDEKASPSVVKWTLIGGFLGCFIICAIVLIMYMMDDTIKSTEDVERYLQLSTLALIPMRESEEAVRGKKKRKVENNRVRK